MLSRLPHEVRLKIFHYAFAGFGGDIRVQDTADGITCTFTARYDERASGGALSCLAADIVGEGVAAAAAEALYKSKFRFAVDASILCSFLNSCPLSRVVEPGKYIKSLDVFMGEDPKFIGDGKYGQKLRKADWVDLVATDSADSDERITRLKYRTQAMRQISRAILKMPKLKILDFLIMPVQGKASGHDIERFEIREIIPTHFRLCCRGVDARIHLRTWEVREYYPSTAYYRSLSPGTSRDVTPEVQHDVDHDGLEECLLDVGSCLSYHWTEPAAFARAKAENASVRRRIRAPSQWFRGSMNYRLIRTYDALQDYLYRLSTDKGVSNAHSLSAKTFADSCQITNTHAREKLGESAVVQGAMMWLGMTDGLNADADALVRYLGRIPGQLDLRNHFVAHSVRSTSSGA